MLAIHGQHHEEQALIIYMLPGKGGGGGDGMINIEGAYIAGLMKHVV